MVRRRARRRHRPVHRREWKKGQQDELRLSAFKGYWGGWSGKHYTSALFQFVPQPTTQSQLLQSRRDHLQRSG